MCLRPLLKATIDANDEGYRSPPLLLGRAWDIGIWVAVQVEEDRLEVWYEPWSF
jgi:hypothetical protein